MQVHVLTTGTNDRGTVRAFQSYEAAYEALATHARREYPDLHRVWAGDGILSPEAFAALGDEEAVQAYFGLTERYDDWAIDSVPLEGA